MALAQNNCVDGRCDRHGCIVVPDSACEVCLAESRGGKWGAVSFQRHTALAHLGIHLHVFYQGEDVTRRCNFADDTGEGVARLFKHREGKRYVDEQTGEVADEHVTGIEFRIGEPL